MDTGAVYGVKKCAETVFKRRWLKKDTTKENKEIRSKGERSIQVPGM